MRLSKSIQTHTNAFPSEIASRRVYQFFLVAFRRGFMVNVSRCDRVRILRMHLDVNGHKIAFESVEGTVFKYIINASSIWNAFRRSSNTCLTAFRRA